MQQQANTCHLRSIGVGILSWITGTLRIPPCEEDIYGPMRKKCVYFVTTLINSQTGKQIQSNFTNGIFDELANFLVAIYLGKHQWGSPTLICRVWVVHSFDDELDNV